MLGHGTSAFSVQRLRFASVSAKKRIAGVAAGKRPAEGMVHLYRGPEGAELLLALVALCGPHAGRLGKNQKSGGALADRTPPPLPAMLSALPDMLQNFRLSKGTVPREPNN